jgi:hypothetical protein
MWFTYVIKVCLNITKRYEVLTACNGEEGLSPGVDNYILKDFG